VGTQPLSLTPEFALQLDGLGLSFMAEILEAAIERRPENLAALAELGHVYTRQGRVEKGLAVDRELVRLSPDNPTAHYNLACSLALTGSTDPAIESLRRAIELGYDDPEFLTQDKDLDALRDDPRFQALVQSLRERALGGPIQ
jgi:Flp pilus assembly protein TadD